MSPPPQTHSLSTHTLRRFWSCELNLGYHPTYRDMNVFTRLFLSWLGFYFNAYKYEGRR